MKVTDCTYEEASDVAHQLSHLGVDSALLQPDDPFDDDLPLDCVQYIQPGPTDKTEDIVFVTVSSKLGDDPLVYHWHVPVGQLTSDERVALKLGNLIEIDELVPEDPMDIVQRAVKRKFDSNVQAQSDVEGVSLDDLMEREQINAS